MSERIYYKCVNCFETYVVPPDTNIVMVDLPRGMAAADVAALAKTGDVLISAWTPSRIRAVTHLDVDCDKVTRAAVVRAAIERCAQGAA